MKDEKPSDSQPSSPSRGSREKLNLLGFSQVGLFVLGFVCALYFARPVLLPLILALILALLVKPIQRLLERHLRLSSTLSAATVIAALVAAIVLGLSNLAVPAASYASQLREEIVQNRLRTAFQPVKKVHEEITEVAEKVETIATPSPPPPTEPSESASGGKARSNAPAAGASPAISTPASGTSADTPTDAPPPPPPAPVKVEIRENPVGALYEFVGSFSAHAFITVAMVYFFLAFGDRILRRLEEIDYAPGLVAGISQEVSRYLFTVASINTGLGLLTGVAMALLGMPNPILWGAMAAILNFIPYLGAIAGTVIVCLVAAITFDHASQILPVPIVYYLLTAIEGNFVTPTIIGRQFTINPIIVFIWVLSWGALWGVPGMLIGLPLLMVVRIIISKTPRLAHLERLVSA